MPQGELRNLTCGFARGFRLPALDRVLSPGLTHLSGPNGCGKSTLLRTLAGELRPLTGCFWIDGRDTWRDAAARRNLGFLGAQAEWPGFLSVTEAWRFSARLRGRPDWNGAELIDALGLPSGLRLDQLSHGQRRAAELVAALAGEPSVLLLDEPLVGLDQRVVALLDDWLRAWARERIILVTGHAGEAVLQSGTRWELASPGR